MVAAIVVGLWTYGLVGASLAPYLSSRRLANLAGFGLVFCGMLVAGSLVGFVVGKLLKITGLSFFRSSSRRGFRSFARNDDRSGP